MHGVHWAHGPINVISVDFKDNHFEFRVYQELTKSHMDFSVSSFSHKNMGLETKILSLSILENELVVVASTFHVGISLSDIITYLSYVPGWCMLGILPVLGLLTN